MIVTKQQLEEKTQSIRDEQFNESEISLIPTLETQGLTFGNSGRYFYATVLYRFVVTNIYINAKRCAEKFSLYNRAFVAFSTIISFWVIIFYFS